MDEYEKNWDMLNVGNFGSATIEDLLYSEKKCIYLLERYTDESDMQDHFELIAYIKQNYCKIGEVTTFDVYEKR